ncbi:hypothetical protein AAG906_013511 [Vitis piasezkii]
MLEDDVRAATQQVLVAGGLLEVTRQTGQASGPAKPVDRRQEGPSRRISRLTPLSVPWSYNGDMPVPPDLVERLIKAGHLKQYLRSDTRDGTIIFPPVDPTRTLQPHRDALILSLEIGEFDVRRILVDPGDSPT